MSNPELGTAMRPELLSLMLKRDFWNEYKFKIVPEMFPGILRNIYKVVREHHDEENSTDLDPTKLWELVKIKFPSMPETNRLDVYELTQRLKEVDSWDNHFAATVLESMWKQEVFRQIAEQGILGAEGKVSSLEAVKDIVEKHSDGFIPKDTFVECTMDLEELIEAEKNIKKWEFNLKTLNDKTGSLNPGHFMMVMARPDAGKTSFLASLVCGPGGYLEQGAKIDWYGNEEPIRRVRWRCLNAFTGMSKADLLVNRKAANDLWKSVDSRIHTFEIPATTSVEYIDARVRDRKPDILIVDQVDKLTVQPQSREFAGEVERIRALYVKYREIAKKYNCVVIGVCQASADAEGHRYVTYDMAENSKTGKAAECDLFLGIGRSPLKVDALEVEEDYKRYITASKNKLDTGWKGAIVCNLRPTIARYEP